ncbi:MAG: PHP domain-containing protein [Thermosipho sp. (in: Bacteria)]|nr:PHP domain-containing protein [Thermosipho sp. (in: thermotogales)]
MKKLSVDFHNHSIYSYDGELTLEDFLNNDKIDVFAITDHNNFKYHEIYSNGKVLYKIENKYFITGEEIMTSDAGEVIGLFIKQKIEPFMTFEETIKEIKRQNGIVYLPHPYDFYRRGRPKLKVVLKYIDEIDMIEVFNAKYFTDFEVKMSFKLAEKYKKIKGYGSDAHKLLDLAKGYVVLKYEDFDINREKILDLLSDEPNVLETVQIKRSFLKSLLKKLR